MANEILTIKYMDNGSSDMFQVKIYKEDTKEITRLFHWTSNTKDIHKIVSSYLQDILKQRLKTLDEDIRKFSERLEK